MGATDLLESTAVVAPPAAPEVVVLSGRTNTGLFASPADFERLSADNRDLRLGRLATGEVIVTSPAGSKTSSRNARLTLLLGMWNEAAQLGVVFDSSAGFTLPNGAIHSPDAAWISAARWSGVSPEQQERFAPICPDFVAELASPSDRLADLRERMLEFLNQGARLGWLLDPRTATVEVYRPSQPIEILNRPETLSGEDVLPGFVPNLKGILFD
jgi:Uma2 family endonuclease